MALAGNGLRGCSAVLRSCRQQAAALPPRRGLHQPRLARRHRSQSRTIVAVGGFGSLFERLRGNAPEQQTLRLVEARLASAPTQEAKVEALLSACDALDALSERGLLQLEGGRGSGGMVADREAAMRRRSDQLSSLARQHGVEQEFAEALQARYPAFTWGSGLEGAPLAALTCANVDAAAGRACAGAARHVCPRCRLVAYCSPECAAQHRHVHGADCDSHLAAQPFVPRWAREGRMPGFMNPFGGGCARGLARGVLHAAGAWCMW